MSNYWGWHAMLDCGSCDIDKITDGENIKNFSRVLVERIDMKAYGEPIAVHFAEHDPDKAGYSLVQLIETSNICAHFVDKNGDAYLDVFSCKEFSIEEVEKVFREFFNPKTVRVNFLHRKAS